MLEKANEVKKYVKTMRTPLGNLTLVADDRFLLLSAFEKEGLFPWPQESIVYRSNPVLEQAEHELSGYFAGSLSVFTVPYQIFGTEFQKEVWLGLTRIPYGQSISYEALAGQIGRPKACRAVGQANNRNPLLIIVPCHRVIGKNGALVGYGGGLDRKVWLLNLEKQGQVRAR